MLLQLVQVTSGVLLDNKQALTMTPLETRFASLSGKGHPSSRGDLPCAAPSLAAYKHCGEIAPGASEMPPQLSTDA